MDWTPSRQQRPQSAAPGNQVRGNPETSTPAPTAAQSEPARATPALAGAEPASGNDPRNDPAADPWTRAVEQAPGVWVVGEATNVGKQTPSNASEAEVPATAPRYEPATAQVPPSIPVNPAAEPAREYAMASAPAPAPAATSTATTVAAPPARTETRQSLYQRLSNSPEAEAGRAKAPARAVAAAAATYVQDVPSADDETIEESGVFGRAAVERILGGKLIEERSADGSPVPSRY